MVRFGFLFILVWCMLALPVRAVEIAVTDDLVVEVDLRQGWTLHLEPPEALVKEMAVHVAHEPAAAKATAEQVERVVRKRMAANEAIVYHAASGACLYIDFSALDPGQSAPGAKTLRNSAEYAAESLASEEDVAGVKWQVTPYEVNGADDAFLLVADYLQHDQPMKFHGVIGYTDGFWFYFYYTDPGKDPAALAQMTAMLKQLTVRSLKH